MTHRRHRAYRRTLLLAAGMLPLALTLKTRAQTSPTASQDASVRDALAALERTSGGRLGVCAIDTEGGGKARAIGYRADERFAVCSTFKVVLAAAILARSLDVPGLMQRRIRYTKQDLAHYSPVSSKHVRDGMTVAELCQAAIQYSDNTAANQLMKVLGGPQAVTAYAHATGNTAFRLDRWETELNTAIPGDLRDTSTPAAMAHTLETLTVGQALPAAQRDQLVTWLRGNTTGAHRIRAGVPGDWAVGDKTGTGDYGTTNDLAILWPPRRAPVMLAVYFTQREPKAKARDDVIAAAARIVAGALG
ncbi:class A beta-lactamase [Paraburkholderia kururiensis]|uniref:Beta-lactamase n=1 Tax=Paraburkholderia kururiensis TaxID=984307 RepID=A0ABZ0WPU8_9BURK|nr:class A beta-lactamase [Paraburkholderia kururiensis]WQD79285.1 class A beta-lactamase [Paraburkholderia kururiensis]